MLEKVYAAICLVLLVGCGSAGSIAATADAAEDQPIATEAGSDSTLVDSPATDASVADSTLDDRSLDSPADSTSATPTDSMSDSTPVDAPTTSDADAGSGGYVCKSDGAICSDTDECCEGSECLSGTCAPCTLGLPGASCRSIAPICCLGSVCELSATPPIAFKCSARLPLPTQETTARAPSGPLVGGLGAAGSPLGGHADTNYQYCADAAGCVRSSTMRDCVLVAGHPEGGLCSHRCAADADCPSGSCIAFGSVGFCLRTCPLFSGGRPTDCDKGSGHCKTLTTIAGGTASACSYW